MPDRLCWRSRCFQPLISGHNELTIPKIRWWFQTFFIFTPILGEMIQMIHFDEYFSNGEEPPTRRGSQRTARFLCFPVILKPKTLSRLTWMPSRLGWKKPRRREKPRGVGEWWLGASSQLVSKGKKKTWLVSPLRIGLLDPLEMAPSRI